jgi:aryl-alcohol dehydrogenase-like predicted oxidoreductase
MKYKLLGKSGLRVSELCLGTMTFGEEWGWGSDEKQSREIFDIFAEAGGNFIDTANRYTEGTSERFVGDFIREDRDKWVLATKYTLFDRKGDLNFAGNHRKNMMRSVEESLKRLKTDFIDVFWVHAWDGTTPIEEILRGLDDLIRSGKVHYIGISDTPAWVVSQANTIANLRGWTEFVGLQVEYSMIQRTVERDLLPMADAFGMSVTNWGAIGGGVLTGKYLNGGAGRVPEHSIRRTVAKNDQIAAKSLEIAQKMGVPASALAIQWTRQNRKNILPIVGARLPEQLKQTLECLNFEIPADFLAELNQISAIEMGFPHDFLKGAARDIMFSGREADLIF